MKTRIKRRYLYQIVVEDEKYKEEIEFYEQTLPMFITNHNMRNNKKVHCSIIPLERFDEVHIYHKDAPREFNGFRVAIK